MGIKKGRIHWIVILFISLLSHFSNADSVLFSQSSGYVNGINNDSSNMSIETSTNCKSGATLCLKVTAQTANAYIGFSNSSSSFSYASNKYLEFDIYLVSPTTGTTPTVSVFMQSVATPVSVTLDSVSYVSGSIIDGWQTARVRLDQLNVDSDFNGVRMEVDIQNSIMYISNVQLLLNPTGTVPPGFPQQATTAPTDKSKSNNTSKIVAGILVPFFVILIGVIVVVIWRKKKRDSKYIKNLYEDQSTTSKSHKSTDIEMSRAISNEHSIKSSPPQPTPNPYTPEEPPTPSPKPTPLPPVPSSAKTLPTPPTSHNSIGRNSSNMNPSLNRNSGNPNPDSNSNLSINSNSGPNSRPGSTNNTPNSSFVKPALPPVPKDPQRDSGRVLPVVPTQVPRPYDPNQVIYTNRPSKPGLVNVDEVFTRCIDYLTQYGLHEEGLLRLAGNVSEVQQIKSQFDQGSPVNFWQTPPTEVHSVGDVLKKSLRELKEPLISCKSGPMKAKVDECINDDDSGSQLEQLKEIVYQSGSISFSIMSILFPFLQTVSSNSQYNKMTNSNLAMVFSPTLNLPPDLIDLLIRNSSKLF